MSEIHITRRNFLKAAGIGVAGTVAYAAIPMLSRRSPVAAAAAEGGRTPDLKLPDWRFVVDTTRCIGCGRCVVACKTENNVPAGPGYNRTWVERYEIAPDGRVTVDSPNAGRDGFTTTGTGQTSSPLLISKGFFVPKLCNQCDNPPCVRVCPVGATYKTDDGVVLVNQNRCIGCRYCIQACPYGARYLRPDERVADKCTWCYHRIKRGHPPACVEACPVKARMFGDYKDPDGEIRRALSNNRVSLLKPSHGTKPRVYYIGLEKDVL